MPAEPTPNEALHDALALVAPGTPLRDGIDRIVRAKMGALLVLSDEPRVITICSGGFMLDATFSPQRLSELATMDGAIIISTDGTRIDRAIQALQTLERYKTRLDDATSPLTSLEIDDVATVRDVLHVLQRGTMVRQIAAEIETMIVELGVDARLLRLQLDEVFSSLDHEIDLVGELSKVLRATADEIATVPGMSRKTEVAVKDTLDRLTESTILDQYI